MHCFSLLFFSLFNVYELKYFVKYWKTGKPLRTTACVADALNRYTNYSDPGGTAGNSWWVFCRLVLQNLDPVFRPCLQNP